MSAQVIALPAKPETVGKPTDDRYRSCLGDAEWRRLPAAVQRRFSKKLADGEQTIYRGEVVAMEMSRSGAALAHMLRPFGAPLPFTCNALGACVVIVTESSAQGGQVWSRCYPRAGGFPQVVHSAKRFSGPTGIEECLGWGLVMRLAMAVVPGGLQFRSKGFAFEIAGWRVPLPQWLVPLDCTVEHRAETDDRFSFSLIVEHRWSGRLLHQVAFFDDR